MPFPINPVHRLLLENGSYLLLEDPAPLIESNTGANTGVTALVIAKSQNTVTGDMVLVTIIGNTATDQITSVTAPGMTFAKITAVSGLVGGGAASYVSVWYAYNVTGNTTPSITINKTATWDIQAIVKHYRGLTTTDPLDKTAKSPGTTVNVTSGATATLSQANELIVGFGASDFGGATYTPGAAYSDLTQISAVAGDIAVQDTIVYTTAAVTSTMTLSSTTDQLGGVLTFKIAQNPSDLILDEQVAIDDPLTGATLADTTPTLTFAGYNSTNVVSTYYFDGSDAAATDPNAVWTNDTNAFDGSILTSASSSTTGSASSNFLMAEGTNAPGSGGAIQSVRTRIYYDPTNADVTHNIYTDGLGELLFSNSLGPVSSPGWSNYSALTAPSGGWTWAGIQALEVKLFKSAGIGAALVYRVEVEVTSAPLLTYEVQIDTVNTFNSASTIIDSYVGGASGTSQTIFAGSATYNGHSFVGDGGILSSVEMYLRKDGVPPGSMFVEIYNVAGNYGSGEYPIGSPIATSVGVVADSALLVSTDQFISFSAFDNTLTLGKGTIYAAILHYNAGDGSNLVRYNVYGSGHPGSQLQKAEAGAWNSAASSTNDVSFKVISTVRPFLDRTSDIDTGFKDEITGLSDDDDLLLENGSKLLLEDGTSFVALNRSFPTTNHTSFTVQAANALAAGTYYWRARRKSVANGGTYGTWSETRSFIVSAGTTTRDQTGISRITQVVTKDQTGVAFIVPAKTFGTISGIGLTTGGLDQITGTKYTLTEAGTIDKLWLWTPNSGNAIGAIYSDVAGVPTTKLVEQTTPAAMVAGRFNPINIPDTALSAGDYWLVFMASASNMKGWKAGGTNQTAYNLSTVYGGGTFPTTFPTPSYQNNDYVAFADYTTAVTTTRDQTGKARIELVTTRDQTGKARITATATRDQTGTSRITVTTTKDQTGVSRIQLITTRDQTGKADIFLTVTRDQTGISRVTITTTRDQTGVSRITVVTARDQTGKADIFATATRDQTGVARITATATRDQTGISRITITTTRDQTGVSRITIVTTRDQTGKADITATTTRDQTGKADIKATTTRDQTGVARITITTVQNQTGISRITVVVTKDQTGISRITATTTRDQTGKANLVNVSTRDQTGIANIKASITRDQLGKADILVSVNRDQTGISRIQITTTRDQTGLSRITATATRDQTGKADILSTITQNQTGVARITVTVARDQTGVSRITITSTRDQTGISRITAIVTRDQAGKADILSTTTRDQTGKARIQITTLQTITGVARIALITTRDQTGVSRITTTVTKDQTGVSRITITTTRDQTGKARITIVTAQNQTGVSRITAVVTRDQTGRADITNTATRDQTGVSRITITTTRDQTGISRITAVVTRNQTGVGRITVTTTRDQTGIATVSTGVQRQITGVARITLIVGRDQTGVSSITATTLRTITGLGRITASAVRDQTGVSRITVATTRDQTGVTRITATVLQTQTGKGSIQIPTLRTITGISALVNVQVRNQTGVSYIVLDLIRTTFVGAIIKQTDLIIAIKPADDLVPVVRSVDVLAPTDAPDVLVPMIKPADPLVTVVKPADTSVTITV